MGKFVQNCIPIFCIGEEWGKQFSNNVGNVNLVITRCRERLNNIMKSIKIVFNVDIKNNGLL